MVETLELKENENPDLELSSEKPKENVSKKLSSTYWKYVLDVNAQFPEKIQNNRNGQLRTIKKVDYLKSEMNRKLKGPSVPQDDEVDGIFPEAGSVRDEFYGKENYSEMISCVPKVTCDGSWPFPVRYTGFPLFFVSTMIFQIAGFVYFYTGDRCSGTCSIQNYNSEMSKSIFILPSLSEVQMNGEIWRFWTYQFLHANIEHILSNILVSSLLGITLEMVHGPLRIATLYTVGVILGACYHLIITPNSYLVGASGGCYALIGAQVANFMLNFKEYTIYSKVIRAAVLGCFLLADVAMAVIRMSQDDNVSWAAHLGGFLVGITLGLVIMKNFKVSRNEIFLQVAALISFASFILVTSFIMIWKYFAFQN